MAKNIALAALLVLVGCSHQRVARESLEMRGDSTHPIFVGHSDTGELVVAASHYDAMQGMAVTAAELGGKGNDELSCMREMITGTHVPKWVCRYKGEMEQERRITQDYLDTPRLSLGRSGAAGIAAAPQIAPPPH